MRAVLKLVNSLGIYMAAYPLTFVKERGYIVTRQADTEQYCYMWSVTDTGLHYIETNS